MSKEYPVEKLRLMVMLFNCLNETFNMSFESVAELEAIFDAARAHDEWPELPDSWTDEQIEEALKDTQGGKERLAFREAYAAELARLRAEQNLPLHPPTAAFLVEATRMAMREGRTAVQQAANDFDLVLQARIDREGVFVANADGTFTHGPCTHLELDLGDDEVQVWEDGSDGWVNQPDPCNVCGKPIDVVVDGEDE